MVTTHGDGDQLETGVRIGDFEIEKRLGAGGMGIVYQARQVSLNRRVALKVLGPALTRGSGLARFQREAQAVARLNHPGIATLYFIGQDAELCYHVMELVDGLPLRRVIDRLSVAEDAQSGPDSVVTTHEAHQDRAEAMRLDQPTKDLLTTDDVRDTVTPNDSELSAEAKQMRRSQQYVRRCCEIVRDAAQALAYAHGEGVVHRDIKPENLMLDRQGKVHIIDFGLARFFDDLSITNTGQLVGTPLYMSPEQVTGRIKVDHRTDIYSLGLVLYELLALRRPFESTSRENLLLSIVTKALPPLSCRNRSVPRELEAVVHMATHKDPEERYQTAKEFVEDLERVLDGKPVSAPVYRYRFDARETVAGRPGVVVLSAFLVFLAGVTSFVTIASMSLMMSVMLRDQYIVPITQGLVALTALGIGAVCTHGLLTGWNWTRWVVIGLAVLVILGCIAVAIGLVVMLVTIGPIDPAPPKGDDKAVVTPQNVMLGMFLMYLLPVLLALLCAITTIVSLLLPSTGAWFRQARQARLEHQRTLEMYGD